MRKNWHWIELIGFDNTSPDYGVDAFLSRLAKAPEGVSLLFSHIDFLNTFTPEGEYPLLPCDCSYSGHEFSVERRRQLWTNLQLKGLIRTLQAAGVKVIFAFFNFSTYTDDQGQKVTTPFCAAHTELWGLNRKGIVRPNNVCILKRMADGSFYEDFLLEKMKQVIDYYGFDGVQIADGISCSRPTVQKGDFSDDTVAQFCDWLTKKHPKIDQGKLGPTSGNTSAYQRRRRHILDALLYEFLCFSADRWGGFYQKLYQKIDPAKYLLFINSFWTREPFEAFYRYGIDYACIAHKDVYALMIEEVSTTMPTFSAESRGGFHLPLEKSRYLHYEFFLMQMLLKCYLPTLKQVPLLPIGDTQEEWNAIHDAANELKRAVYRRNNCKVFWDKAWRACAEAPFFCLSDGICAADWAKLDEWDSRCVSDEIDRICGLTLYYSTASMRDEVARYIKTRDYSFVKLANELLAAGAPIASVVTASDIADFHDPLLVLFPERLPKEELDALLASPAPCIFLSRERAFGTPLYEGQIILSLKGVAAEWDETLAARLRNAKGVKACAKGDDAHGAIWTSPLKYNEWKKCFLRALADALIELCHAPRLVPKKACECKLTTFQKKDGRLVMLVSNDEYCNATPVIELERPIRSVRSLTKYEGYRIPVDGCRFTASVAPRTMELLEIELLK